MIDNQAYYMEYHGHTNEDLFKVMKYFKNDKNKKSFIYLAGDSSLDNKYWILGAREPAINGYENILSNKQMVPDVCFQLNKLLINSEMVCINTAVEESTLSDRKNKLLP